jgi:hypothetical protein
MKSKNIIQSHLQALQEKTKPRHETPIPPAPKIKILNQTTLNKLLFQYRERKTTKLFVALILESDFFFENSRRRYFEIELGRTQTALSYWKNPGQMVRQILHIHPEIKDKYPYIDAGINKGKDTVSFFFQN